MSGPGEFMRPSTDWQEKVEPGEAEHFEAYAQELRALQHRNARSGKLSRALHAKGPPGLEATFSVLPNLPEHARPGLFAAPASYRAYVRFSNGSGGHHPDARKDVRGIAIKLLGVKGKKIIPGMEDATTQDFLLITSPATPVSNADEFLGLLRVVASPLTGLPKFVRQVGLGRFLKIAKQGGKSLSVPTISVATRPYYSALPIQFGEYAVKYALKPHQHSEPGARRGSGADYLRDELEERLRRGPLSFDFQVQFYVDEQRTPIEDAAVEWRESDAPFVTLARLDLPKQDLASPRGQRLQEYVERLSFDPWHALNEFRPLGNMMRARNVAYRVSTQERKAAPEPDGAERFD